MEELKQLLYDECMYKMPDEVLDRFLNVMSEVRLKDKEALIPYGKIDNSLYIQKSGIIRFCYFDGDVEKTYGFALPGTVMISYHSFHMHKPSFFQLESCGESVVCRVSKKDVDSLIDSSHEFAKWIISLSMGQLYFVETKISLINGRAKERFMSMIKNRPEIINRVPMKIIASYLGVAPEYLYRLKKDIK